MRTLASLPKSFSLALLILLLVFTQCKFEEDVYFIPKITGQVQKGPFINGTEVQMYGLHSSLDQSGKIYSTVINNNKGSFAINNVELSSQYVSFSASGYYFNEITGEISSSPISLFAISFIQDLTAINVNIMTHLEKARVEFLVGKKTNTFLLAKETAQAEILSIFGFSLEEMDNSETLDISQSSEENAILLAVSIILQGNRSVGDLTELLANIITDMEQDGILDDKTILPELRSSTLALDLANIRSNLESRYSDLGITSSVPDFEKYINIFLGFTGGAPVAITLQAIDITKNSATLKGTVNANSLSTIVTFEYGTTVDYGAYISATPGTVNGTATMPVSAALTDLTEGTLYHYRVKAVNSSGTYLGEDKTFTTSSTPPLGMLVAYYPFNGNANDESGNGNNGTIYNATLTLDRFGKSNSAYDFNGNNQYISFLHNSIPTGNSARTLNLWFKTSATGEFGIFNWGTFGTSQRFGFVLYGDKPYFCGESNDLIGTVVVNDGKWHCVTITYDGTTVKMFIDSELNVFENKTLNTGNNSMVAGMSLLDHPRPTNFIGSIDDIRIYNKVLSDSEIKGLYHEGGYETSGTVTDVDGNIYKTVQIGSQVWMAENLKTTKYNNGEPIPNVTNHASWITLNSGAYCNYNNDVSYVSTYGRLYNYYAVEDSRKLCPTGWHVANENDWNAVEDYLGGRSIAASKMLEGPWNSSGFTARCAGARNYSDVNEFFLLGAYAHFWVGTSNSPESGLNRRMQCGWAQVEHWTFDKKFGASVRCIAD